MNAYAFVVGAPVVERITDMAPQLFTHIARRGQWGFAASGSRLPHQRSVFRVNIHRSFFGQGSDGPNGNQHHQDQARQSPWRPLLLLEVFHANQPLVLEMAKLLMYSSGFLGSNGLPITLNFLSSDAGGCMPTSFIKRVASVAKNTSLAILL